MIRKLQETDAEAVAALEGELFPDVCWNEMTVKRELRIGWGLIAVEKNKVVGYLLARFDNDITDIIRIGVTTKWQKQGIGRALLKQAIEQIASRLMLAVRLSNGPAMKLYLSEGFHPVGATDGSVLLVREEG